MLGAEGRAEEPNGHPAVDTAMEIDSNHAPGPSRGVDYIEIRNACNFLNNN